MVSHPRKTILLVGQDPDWKEWLSNVLQPFQLAWVAHKSDAMKLIAEEGRPVDMLLTDASNGSALVKWAREHCDFLPVIVADSHRPAMDKSYLLDLGALSVLEGDEPSRKLMSLLQTYFALDNSEN